MKKLILCLIFACLIPLSAIGEIYLGEFGIGDKFDTIQVEGYSVSLVYRGTIDGVMLLYILSSPENPVISGGYAYVSKMVKSSPYYFFWFHGIRYHFTLGRDNIFDVWKQESAIPGAPK